METEEKKAGMAVVRHRGNYRCLRDGVSFIFKHFNEIAKFTWPLTVVFVVLGVVLLHSLRFAAFADIDGNVAAARVYVLLATLLVALAGVAFQSGVVWQQRGLMETGYLPCARLKTVWRDVLKVSWRVLIIDIVMAVMFCLLVLLCGVLHVAVVQSVGTSAGAVSVGHLLVMVVEWVLAFCLFMVLLGGYWQVFHEYILGNVSLRAAVCYLGWGWRYLGRGVLLDFVCLLLTALIALLMSVPSIVCSYIDGTDLQMRLGGELAQLPSYYPYVLLLSWVLSAVGLCLAYLFIAFPMCLGWGAVRATEAEREGKQ